MKRRGFIKSLLAIGSAVVADPIIGRAAEDRVIVDIEVDGRQYRYAQVLPEDIDVESPITMTTINKLKRMGGA